MSDLRHEIENLSASEKAELLDAVWESLEADALSLTDEQRAARECGGSPTEYSLRFKSTGLWSSPASTAGATQDVGKSGNKVHVGDSPGFPILEEMGCPTLVAAAVGATGGRTRTALESHPSP